MVTLPLTELIDVITASDPAAGRSSEQGSKRTNALKRSARQTIVTVGQDRIGRVFCLDVWADRVPIPDYVEKIIMTNRRWRPRRFRVEANGMQILFGGTMAIIAKMRGENIPFEEVWQPTNIKKPWRIRTQLQPFTANGRLFLQENQTELKAELLGHPNYPTCDIVDALATAVAALPDRALQYQQQSDEERNLAAYLRESGCPPSQIADRLAEIRREMQGVR